MEEINRIILTLVHFASVLRDTLEYSLVKDEYNYNFYSYKKKTLDNDLTAETPIKVFCKNNGEKGENLLNRLIEFKDKYYGQESKCIKVKDDKVSVDHALNVELLTDTIPLYEELNNIIFMHIQKSKELKKDDPQFDTLYNASDRYFRAVTYLTYIAEINKLFEEFNKVMNENKGVRGPATNFIEQDLSKLTNYLYQVRKYARCTDALFSETNDKLFAYLEMIMGKRDLPAGKKFPDVHKEVIGQINVFLQDAEPKWKEIYIKLAKVFEEENKKILKEKTKENLA